MKLRYSYLFWISSKILKKQQVLVNQVTGLFLWQDDFMNLIITFMASLEYIRNPFLRAKMVEVFNFWMPQRYLSTYLLILSSYVICLQRVFTSFYLCVCAVAHLLLPIYFFRGTNSLFSILWRIFWNSMLISSSQDPTLRWLFCFQDLTDNLLMKFVFIDW